MKSLVNLISLFLLLALAGCAANNPDSKNNITDEYFLSLYSAYIRDIQTEKFPSTIEDHFTSTYINGFKKEHNLTVVKPSDVGWIVYSTYMPISSMKKHYLKYKTRTKACFTAIGQSHDGLPMSVNFEFIQEASNHWRINKHSGNVFDDSVVPSFPDIAICP